MLSLKIVVYIIDPASKSRHAVDQMSEVLEQQQDRWSITLGCSSLHDSKVSFSGDELELDVGDSEPQSNPRSYI